MKINFFTKDSTVFPFVSTQIPARKVEKGPSDSRIVVIDRAEYPAAKPDRNGNFLYTPQQPQFDACEPYGVLKLGAKLYSEILSRDLPFAFQGKLRILPHDEEGINAYYNREDQGIHFLFFSSPALKKELVMAQSLDVGSHEENGHMLLDGLCPEYLNLELESQAFHEAFGDISSMILALQFDQVIDRMLLETKGDLAKSNVLSKLGEEAGGVIQLISPHPKKNHNFLRDATFTMSYDWKYKPPEEATTWIPKDEKKLGAEPHNFSRFFSGVWYEIFAALYEQDPVREKNPKLAVKNARDIASKLIVRGMADFAPDTTARYQKAAKAMLRADAVDNSGKYRNLLIRIFKERNLIANGEKSIETFPKVKLCNPILTRNDAQKFLEKNREALGLDKNLVLEPAEDFPPGYKRFVYRNKKGETFLVYHATQDFSLHGSIYKELEGVEYKITGSIKLGFNKQGMLESLASDLITTEKQARIEKNIRQFLENQHIKIFQDAISRTHRKGRAKSTKLPSSDCQEFFFKDAQNRKIPYFAFASWKRGKMTLQRVPIFM